MAAVGAAAAGAAKGLLQIGKAAVSRDSRKSTVSRESTVSRRSTVVRPQAEQTSAEDEQPWASVEEEAEAEPEPEAPPWPPLTIDHEAALGMIDHEGEAEAEAEPEEPPSPPLPAQFTVGEASPRVLSSSDAAAASLPSFRGESSGEETPNPKRGKTLAPLLTVAP